MSGLSPEQQQFVAYRLSGLSIEETAKATGITPRTGYRWMKLQSVLDALAGVEHHVQEEVAQSAYEIIATKYQAALGPACDTVINIAKDELAPPAARLKAAQMIQDRLAPANLIQQSQTEAAGPIPAELLTFVLEEELAQIDAILARAQQRKQEADSKVTPIRREA